MISPRPTMDEEATKRLAAIERRVDADYVAFFPRVASWEEGATSLLMAHECAMLASNPESAADLYKYPLMHALRFGAATPSQPNWVLPARLNLGTVTAARTCLEKANEYVGICGAFWRGWNGLVTVEVRAEDHVVFGSNEEWTAFDVLDRQVSKDDSDHEITRRAKYAVRKAARRTKLLSTAASLATETYEPDLETLRHAVPQMDAVGRSSEVLPDDWAFRDLSIDEFRAAWCALRAIAFLHSAVVINAMPPPTVSTALLLVSSRADLARWICRLVDLEERRAQEILAYHVYDRSSPTPDIALAPFIAIGPDVLVAAPSVLWSSSFERNLAARLARDHGDEFAASTGSCAGNMAERLRKAFRERGYLAEIEVDIGTTDIDLLVWRLSKGLCSLPNSAGSSRQVTWLRLSCEARRNASIN